MVSAVAEQYLHRAKAIFTSHAALPARSLGVHKKFTRGHSQDRWPSLTKGIFHTTLCHEQNWKMGKREEGEGCSKEWCWSSQETVTGDEPSCPGSSWTPACWWQVANKFFVLLCLCTQLLLCEVNCFYLTPRVLTLLPFWFSSLPT